MNFFGKKSEKIICDCQNEIQTQGFFVVVFFFFFFFFFLSGCNFIILGFVY